MHSHIYQCHRSYVLNWSTWKCPTLSFPPAKAATTSFTHIGWITMQFHKFLCLSIIQCFLALASTLSAKVKTFRIRLCHRHPPTASLRMPLKCYIKTIRGWNTIRGAMQVDSAIWVRSWNGTTRVIDPAVARETFRSRYVTTQSTLPGAMYWTLKFCHQHRRALRCTEGRDIQTILNS